MLRPMPEMNTPWYPWSGTANKNNPADYVKAWKRVRKAVARGAGGKRIKLLWSPYSRSIPDTGANAIRAYFPGADAGRPGRRRAATTSAPAPPLLWSRARRAVRRAPTRRSRRSPPKPFWLAETGSGATGGDKAGWIRTLATLQSTSMPKLAGVVWYDVKDPFGDFRLKDQPGHQRVQRAAEGSCR